MNWIAKLSTGSEVEDQKNNISECTGTDTPKPLKLVEPLLKPCSICGGLEMNWREIAKDKKLRFKSYRQNRQNRQNPSQNSKNSSFVNSVNIVNRVQTLKKTNVKIRTKTKMVLLSLGYKCSCNSISYKQNAFRWQDFKGRYRPGFICCQCGTRYKFV